MKREQKKKQKWEYYPDAAALTKVRIRLIEPKELPRWNELVDKHHYLSSKLVGPQLRYVAEVDEEWVVLLSIGQAAIHLADRDQFIGWNDVQRGRRLKFIGQNNRLVVLSDPNKYPNLVSRVMKLMTRRVSRDWENQYDNPLFALETFVNRQYFLGTCYRASGWNLLGKTKGFSRARQDFYEKHDQPKEIYFRVLKRSGMKLLLRENLPEKLKEFETQYRRCSHSAAELRSLFDLFTKVKDPRDRRGRRYPLQTMLAIIAMATAAGMKGHRAIASFASYLTQKQLQILRCPKSPKTGEYRSPRETCIRELMYHVSSEEIENILAEWMQRLDPAERPNIAIDGKTIKGTARRDENGKKIEQLHLVMACTHDGRMIAQESVDKKENEIVAVPRILERIPPLYGATITGDAMNAQQNISHIIVFEKGGTTCGGSRTTNQQYEPNLSNC